MRKPAAFRPLFLQVIALWCVTFQSVAAAVEARPVIFEALYVADVLHNAHGGLRKGTGYLDDIHLDAHVDAEQVLGLSGGQMFISGHANTSGNFSTRYSGDFQYVSNIDTMPSAHLFEAWYQQTFSNPRWSLRAGLYDVASEFDVNPAAALFISSSQGTGVDLGQTGRNGPSIFPVTSLAARIAWSGENVSLKVAVLDGVPGDPADPRRTAIKLGHGDGALLLGEASYRWDRIHVALGAWAYTAQFNDLAAVTSVGEPLKHRDNRGIYGFVAGRVLGTPGGQALDLYVRMGDAQAAVNPVATYLGLGAVYTGFSPSRPSDGLGIAMSMARTGASFRTASQGMAASHETGFEVTYRAIVTPWLALQPTAQAVLHPGFDTRLRTAVIIGMRFEINPVALFYGARP